MKKLFAILLAVMMIAALAVPAFAADLTVTNASKGVTYQAYKIFDANVDANNSANITFTATEAQKTAIEADETGATLFDFIVDQDGKYTVSQKSTATDDAVVAFFQEHAADLAIGNPIDLEFDETTGEAKATGLDVGYYYVHSGLGAVLSIQTLNEDKEIQDKNSTRTTPNNENGLKSITGTETNENLAVKTTTTDAYIGETVSFKIAFNGVNYVSAGVNGETAGQSVTEQLVKKYTITDNPTYLDIDSESVAITVNGADPVKDATVSYVDGVLTIEIPWVDDNSVSLYEMNDDNVIPVVITYDAKVLDGADDAAATNEVNVNSGYDKQNGDTTVNTYKFTLNKLDENGKALTGAAFALTRTDDSAPIYISVDAEATAAAAEGTVVYVVDPTSKSNTIDMTKYSSAVIKGLDKVSYTVEETQVPRGYNKAENKSVEAAIWSGADDAAKIDFTNQRGSVLPSTGGIGTTIFYVIGGAMVLAAGVLLITKKRLSQVED